MQAHPQGPPAHSPGTPGLLTGTIADNIRFGNSMPPGRRSNGHRQRRLLHPPVPQGYDTLVTGNSANLSQGRRSFWPLPGSSGRSPVLILDEATSSIDTRTESLIERDAAGSWRAAPSSGRPPPLHIAMPTPCWSWSRAGWAERGGGKLLPKRASTISSMQLLLSLTAHGAVWGRGPGWFPPSSFFCAEMRRFRLFLRRGMGILGS